MSIASRKKYFSSKIQEIGICFSLYKTDVRFFNELLELFKSHPDAPGKTEGLIDISIQKTKFNQLGLIIHTDRGVDDISYCACITGKHIDKSTVPYREAIVPQILQFKQDSLLKCCNCSTLQSPFHVDHIYPFRDLLKDFKKSGLESIDDWILYHKKYATLQILCQSCNLKKH